MWFLSCNWKKAGFLAESRFEGWRIWGRGPRITLVPPKSFFLIILFFLPSNTQSYSLKKIYCSWTASEHRWLGYTRHCVQGLALPWSLSYNIVESRSWKRFLQIVIRQGLPLLPMQRVQIRSLIKELGSHIRVAIKTTKFCKAVILQLKTKFKNK